MDTLIRRYKRLVTFLPLIPLLFSFGAVHTLAAQGQCGVAVSIGFPVDTNQFHIAQDFGMPSPRHQGRYHTGEDWFGGRGTSYGTPVRAIADGRVTYSAPNGWGRDGGVVIIEHTMPGDVTIYSMYGHMEQRPETPFPARLSCVKQGDIIGSVGDIRPAPHLHFEMRVSGPDTPGAGYSAQLPTVLGYRHPSRMVLDWQTWLNPAHRWHVELGDESGPEIPPLPVAKGDMILAEPNGRLRYITYDGRVLWRTNTDKPIAALTSFNGEPLVTYTDGGMQPVKLDGKLGEPWATGTPVDGVAVTIGETPLFHTPDNALVAFDAERKVVAWRQEDVPSVARAFAAPNAVGLLTTDHQLLTLSPAGTLLDKAQLRASAGMSATPEGDLLVYSQSGLWRVDKTGTWAAALDGAPPGGESSAALWSPDGKLYLLSGGGNTTNGAVAGFPPPPAKRPLSHSGARGLVSMVLLPSPLVGEGLGMRGNRFANSTANENAVHTTPVLHAYNPDRSPLWQVSLPDIRGEAEMIEQNGVLLITTTGGNVLALQESTGAVCGAARAYGDRRTRAWRELGADGVLRVAVSDAIFGLDWKKFLGPCG
jgi:murein DD-endopeptidase MepM/ murein hydrolase activator NlpD